MRRCSGRGRFDRMALVPAPDAAARRSIIAINTRGMPLEGVDVESIVARTEGYVGADLEAVCREAGMTAMRESKGAEKVHMRHFEAALKVIKPSCTKDVMKWYEEFSRSRDHIAPRWQDPGCVPVGVAWLHYNSLFMMRSDAPSAAGAAGPTTDRRIKRASRPHRFLERDPGDRYQELSARYRTMRS